MPVDSLHSIPVIEEDDFPLAQIDHHTAEPAVQPAEKLFFSFLVEMYQRAGVGWIERMTPGFEPGTSPLLKKVLAVVNQADIPGLVPHRHTVREGAAKVCPPDTEAEPLVDIGA